MAQLLTEGIVDRLLGHFADNLPAKLAALNAEYNDGITLVTPPSGAYFVGERSVTDGPNWPSLYVFGEGMTIERHNATFTDATHEVTITIAVRGLDTEVIQRSLYRYVRALWELLVERFFAVTADDYPLVGPDLHRGGLDPQVVYERPPAQVATGQVIGRATLTATFNKQEVV